MGIELEDRAKRFVTEIDGQITVDWRALADEQRIASESENSSRFSTIFDNLLMYLKEKRVIVYEETPESYFATGLSVPLNPRLSGGLAEYSFVNEKDAREYYSHFFRDVPYALVLHKTIDYVKKASVESDAK